MPELNRAYLISRNAQIRAKTLTAEMVLAERRGELIEKRLVEQQAAYLLVALRQAILNVPQTYARRIERLQKIISGKRTARRLFRGRS